MTEASPTAHGLDRPAATVTPRLPKLNAPLHHPPRVAAIIRSSSPMVAHGRRATRPAHRSRVRTDSRAHRARGHQLGFDTRARPGVRRGLRGKRPPRRRRLPDPLSGLSPESGVGEASRAARAARISLVPCVRLIRFSRVSAAITPADLDGSHSDQPTAGSSRPQSLACKPSRSHAYDRALARSYTCTRFNQIPQGSVRDPGPKGRGHHSRRALRRASYESLGAGCKTRGSRLALASTPSSAPFFLAPGVRKTVRACT
jgi:hypothetical protein